MAQDNLSLTESTEQNTLATIDVSEQEGQPVVNPPTNTGKTASQAGSTQHDRLSLTKRAVGGFGENLFKGVLHISEDVAGKAAEISSGVTKSATELSQGAIKSATELGQGAVKSVAEFSEGVAESTTKLGQEIAKSAFEQEQVRETLLFVVNNTQATQFEKEASVEARVKQVNIINVKKFVAVLKEKFPTKKPEEIAQDVVVQQTLHITRDSAAVSLIPGKLAELMGFDQAILNLTQAETIYQIAEAYGLNIGALERREEALAIFDRAFRSARQMKMSMNLGVIPTLPIVGGLLSAIPVLGGVLNVGSDAFLISLIGDTACQLYKAIAEQTLHGEALKTFKQETQKEYKQRLW